MVVGLKSEKEKFAGAFATYTMEALMHDGKALQSGTSHNLGQHFTKAFDITYTGRQGDIEYPYHTSWGVSTRLIGGLIMVHSDDNGLVLPPKIAPTQLVIIPIAQHKEGVLDKAYEIKKQLEKEFRVEIDDSDGYSPGWKFNQWEMKGVPIRLEIGPRDIKNGQVVIARRDSGEKTSLSMENLNENIGKLLEDIQESLLNKAVEARDKRTFIAKDTDEFTHIIQNTPGFIKAMWCEDRACEDKVKEDTGATIRCIPFEQEDLGSVKCICCGQEAKKMAYFAKAY